MRDGGSTSPRPLLRVRLAALRVGISLELVRTADWKESLEASRSGRCRMLSFLNRTEARDAWLIFTDPIFSDPNVFITREEHSFISDPARLSGESIVFPVGTAMEERIRRDYPNLSVIQVGSEDEAIALIVAAYTIKGEGLFNLKIAGQLPNYTNRLRMGVAKGEPMLRRVLNKGVASITPREVGEIVNRHVSIKVQTGVNYTLLFQVIGGFAVLALIAAYHFTKLNRLNRELRHISETDALTGLPDRGMIDSHLARELECAHRHRRDLAVVMLDIDFF